MYFSLNIRLHFILKHTAKIVIVDALYFLKRNVFNNEIKTIFIHKFNINKETGGER